METFTQLPLSLDPKTKALSTTSNSASLLKELDTLNALHKTFQTDLKPPHVVPPPPIQVDQKRTQMITKAREDGLEAFKKKDFQDAIRKYSLAIEMVKRRPNWEPSGLMKEEISQLYANRAQAHINMREWVTGAADAECSVEMKKVGNAKAWWRRGRCLLEMGRLEDAQEWVKRALETESEEVDLKSLMAEIEQRLKK